MFYFGVLLNSLEVTGRNNSSALPLLPCFLFAVQGLKLRNSLMTGKLYLARTNSRENLKLWTLWLFLLNSYDYRHVPPDPGTMFPLIPGNYATRVCCDTLLLQCLPADPDLRSEMSCWLPFMLKQRMFFICKWLPPPVENTVEHFIIVFPMQKHLEDEKDVISLCNFVIVPVHLKWDSALQNKKRQRHHSEAGKYLQAYWVSAKEASWVSNKDH